MTKTTQQPKGLIIQPVDGVEGRRTLSRKRITREQLAHAIASYQAEERVEYTATSEAFKAEGHFLPKDKSVENDGPLYRAASTGRPAEDECELDLGQASGKYRVWAIPLWTADDQLGSNGENAVAAILRPVSVRKPQRKKNVSSGALLFGENHE